MKYIKETTQTLVKKLLTNHKGLRDNDNKLLASIWYLKANKIEEGALSFLNQISQGNLPSSESIRRCRQKLQELNPELRGKLWNKRHGLQEKIKQELREMK